MEWLRKSGLSKADKESQAASPLKAASWPPSPATPPCWSRVNCETDFVGKDTSFLKFTDTVAEIALKSGAADVDALKAAAYPDAANVEEAAKALIAKIGEKIDVRRMARIESDGVIAQLQSTVAVSAVLVSLRGRLRGRAWPRASRCTLPP